jgi:uroporphyrinogen-III synthase
MKLMSFAGARVLSLESRRSNEMAELIRLNGGDPFVAPALVEVALEDNERAFVFAGRLYDSQFDMMIFLTGVGARLLDRVLATRDPEARFREALRKVAVVARGPKPMAVLREWSVSVAVPVPEPNTWRETLAALESRPEKSVAIQEYGRPSRELVEGLTTQGRVVSTVEVYRWKLPADTAPLAEGMARLLAGGIDVVLFTTSVQLEHLLQFADAQGQKDEVVSSLRRAYIASIGPICTAFLKEEGLPPAMEPSHPKMGILVREAAAGFASSR